MIKYIGLCGKAGSGKDLVANYIKTQLDCDVIALAEPIKNIAMSVFGLSYEQCYNQDCKHIVDAFWKRTPREMLQVIGTDLFRHHFDNNIWIQCLEKSYNKLTVVSDIRFPNELEYYKNNGIVINIIRKHKSLLSEEELNHESEQDLFDPTFLKHFQYYTVPFFDNKNKVWHINNSNTKEHLFENIDIVLKREGLLK